MPVLKHLIYHEGQYKTYITEKEEDMMQDNTWVEEGTLLRLPLINGVKKIEVV